MFEGRSLKITRICGENREAGLSFLAYLSYVCSCETVVSEMRVSEVELKCMRFFDRTHLLF